MPTLSDADSFDEFFAANKAGALRVYSGLHREFTRVFNSVLESARVDVQTVQNGTAVAILLRAAKYLYTAHQLALTGHTEESRVLLRSVVELEMIGFLVFKEFEVFCLWKECFEERMKNTSDGTVSTAKFKARKYEVSEIAKRYQHLLAASDNATGLRRRWGEISTYYSHENLFNIVPRVDQDDSQTSVYVGTSFESNNKRMQSSIAETLALLREVAAFLDEVVQSVKEVRR